MDESIDDQSGLLWHVKKFSAQKKGSPVKRIMDEDLQLSTGTDGLLKFLEASKNLIANLSYKVPILHNLWYKWNHAMKYRASTSYEWYLVRQNLLVL